MISNVSTPSSTPPGARGSARTVPVTRTDDSCVTCSTLLHVSSETSFLKTTHCRYPLPSRMIGNCSFPDVRWLYSQPLTVTFSPTCCANSLIRTVVIRGRIIPTGAAASAPGNAGVLAGWPGGVSPPSPHPLPITQPRLCRIRPNVRPRLRIVARTPNDPIKILTLPNHSSIDHVRRVRLPGMNSSRHIPASFDVHEDMNVIGHHTPRVQLIPRFVEMTQSIRNDFTVLAKNARAISLIELAIEAYGERLI